MSDERALMEHLQHCSAEINSAIREGMYVHMMPPCMVPVTVAGEVIDIGFCLQYEIVPADPKRTKSVDYRDEMTKRRSPDYQPPGGFTG